MPTKRGDAVGVDGLPVADVAVVNVCGRPAVAGAPIFAAGVGEDADAPEAEIVVAGRALAEGAASDGGAVSLVSSCCRRPTNVEG